LVVQNAQRDANFGIVLRHSGHFFSVGSSTVLREAASDITLLIGCITKKKITLAMIINEMMALMKSPYKN
jgi:hypothetical protein